MPTEQALAKQLRLSQPTVHRALARLTRDGVLSGGGRVRLLAADPGAPAQPRPALLVGPVPSRFVREDPGFHAGRQDAIGWILQQELAQAGRVLTLVPPIRALPALEALAPSPATVLIIQAEDLLETLVADLLAWADRRGHHCILYGDPLVHRGRDCVCADQAGGTAGLVHLLAARGCRRILPLWSGDHAGQRIGAWFTRRERGYRRACRDLGLPLLDGVVVPLLDEALPPQAALPGTTRLIAGALAPLLASGLRFDAVLAPTDGMLPALAQALRGLGLDPDDGIALAGFDNYLAGIPEQRLAPCRPVATVDKDHPAIGRALAQLLLDLDPEAAPRRRVIPARVVVLDGGALSS